MRRPPARIVFFDAYALDAGAGIALRDLFERIDRDRFEPLALLPRCGPLVKMLQAVDCPAEIFEPPPLLGAFGRRLAQAGAVDRCRAALTLVRYAAGIARWLRSARIDVLHCNQKRAAFEAGPAGCLAGVPVVWNMRIREHLPRMVVYVCNEYADLIIPLTDGDFAGLADEQALLSKSTIIRNAIATQRFSSSSDRTDARRRLEVGKGRSCLLPECLCRVKVSILRSRRWRGWYRFCLTRSYSSRAGSRTQQAGAGRPVRGAGGRARPAGERGIPRPP